METSLRSADITADEAREAYDAEVAEEEHHIHLPNPSFWPLVLGSAILVVIVGLLFIPDNPWLVAFGAPFVLLGILGWALEDPMGAPAEESEAEKPYVYNPALTPQKVLDQANAIVDQTVTISSTAYSTHPVKVELDKVESNGVILALYGKTELEAQRKLVETQLRELPNVLEVRNFIIAEDAILNIANARLENLRTANKLDGAQDLRILVENYILNLYGDVPNKEMRQMLEREMIGIPGVRVVVNHIGLNKEIPGNLGRTRNKI